MRRVCFALFAAGLVAAGSGCARKVVIDPEAVASRNDPAWVIRNAPTAAPQVSAQPAAPPASTAKTPPAPAVPAPDSR